MRKRDDSGNGEKNVFIVNSVLGIIHNVGASFKTECNTLIRAVCAGHWTRCVKFFSSNES